VRQWKRELLDKTTLPADAISEYSGESKQTGPVTLATYQIPATAPAHTLSFPIFNCLARSWGFPIYDEVHLLPRFSALPPNYAVAVC